MVCFNFAHISTLFQHIVLAFFYTSAVRVVIVSSCSAVFSMEGTTASAGERCCSTTWVDPRWDDTLDSGLWSSGTWWRWEVLGAGPAGRNINVNCWKFFWLRVLSVKQVQVFYCKTYFTSTGFTCSHRAQESKKFKNIQKLKGLTIISKSGQKDLRNKISYFHQCQS